MTKVWHKNYDPGVPQSIDVNEFKNITEILEYGFAKFTSRPAFHNMGTTLTFGQIDVLSRRFASYLQNDLGLKKGDRVAIMMPNILQYPIALFGILRAGLIAGPSVESAARPMVRPMPPSTSPSAPSNSIRMAVRCSASAAG